MSKEAVYGLSVCEDCNKSTEVVYKCYVDDPLWPPCDGPPLWEACGLIEVYKCYECAFGGGE
jgi:hypothetical protein